MFSSRQTIRSLIRLPGEIDVVVERADIKPHPRRTRALQADSRAPARHAGPPLAGDAAAGVEFSARIDGPQGPRRASEILAPPAVALGSRRAAPPGEDSTSTIYQSAHPQALPVTRLRTRHHTQPLSLAKGY